MVMHGDPSYSGGSQLEANSGKKAKLTSQQTRLTWYIMPVIPATWGAEVEGSQSEGSSMQK
jgi:hypothetical protein